MEETQDLLIEIGTEELPPTALRRLSEAFAEGFDDQLAQQRLSHRGIQPFATPRRLALLVEALQTRQPDQEVVRRGPSVQAAFDSSGQPTRAAEGFARSCGVEIHTLQREKTAKGEWLVHGERRPGRPATTLILAMVEQALARLPIPKRMRWGDREDEFVRPVHWILGLFGEQVIEGSLFGMAAGRETRGHRFHHPQPLAIPRPRAYADRLREQAWVEPDFARRRAAIRAQVERLAEEAGGQALLEDDLLDEVTALCEWPVALLGAFDAQFLAVPPEVLIATMQKHQKYFPVRTADGSLLPRFITISNLDSRDPGQVRAGNERVIRPRFADAAFFWQQDLKRPLEAFAPALEQVVFQEKLGSLAEKAARVGRISGYIASLIGFDEGLAARAARLAKCDLMTQMIFEFGSLQGIMGRYYAERSGEDPQVCLAMEEQYLPRQAGDRLPASVGGQILFLAEKLDTLVGIFAIGQHPTGVKDPYALRRAAIGLLRILIETPLALDLQDLLAFTAGELRAKVAAEAAADEVFDYVLERLKGYYQEQGIGRDLVEAVLATGVTVPSDAHRRILAVQAFARLPEAEALSAANKRIRNMLKKAGTTHLPATHDPARLREEAEIQLAERLRAREAEVQSLIHDQDYTGALQALAGLRPAIDRFFDQVLVMVEEEALRDNRLALLARFEALFLGVADISRLRQAGS